MAKPKRTLKGKSFMYKPRPPFCRSLCPKCERGHVVWTGSQTSYHFECTKCKWTSKPLRTGGTRKRIKPDPMPQPKPPKHQPFDVSFISDTEDTVTIRHRDGEILLLAKTIPVFHKGERVAEFEKPCKCDWCGEKVETKFVTYYSPKLKHAWVFNDPSCRAAFIKDARKTT